MNELTTFDLPTHIAYSQSITANITINLSHSCAQAMSLADLVQLSPVDFTNINLEYAPLRGSEELRLAICRYYQQYSQSVLSKSNSLSPDDVVTFCGGQEALAAIYQTVLKPGDEIVVFTPCYPSLISMAEQMGCSVNIVELNQANAWQFSIDEVESLMSAKTKLLVLNSPHNPTGGVIDTNLSKQLLALAIKYQCYLIADEVAQASNYYQLPLTNDYLSYDKAISVGVMSKSLGLAGVRIGWVVSKNQAWLSQLIAVKATGSICISAIDQALAICALMHSNEIIDNNNRLILKNIDLVKHFINEYNHLFEWVEPKAGMLALVKYLGSEGVEVLSANMANNYGVLILPSKLFGLSGNFFRLGLGQNNLSTGLGALKDYCTDFKPT